jgi:hypothetical protein
MSNPDTNQTTEAEIRIKHGAEFPYDAGEEWWDGDGETLPPPATDWAHAAARGILADLNDRRGIKHALHDVDHDVRQKLTADLAEIIRAADRQRAT